MNEWVNPCGHVTLKFALGSTEAYMMSSRSYLSTNGWGKPTYLLKWTVFIYLLLFVTRASFVLEIHETPFLGSADDCIKMKMLLANIKIVFLLCNQNKQISGEH